MTAIGILPMLAVMFLGPLAQLIIRIFYLNGSVDKIWLMILSLFPFSIAPAVMMYLGDVADGQGGTPYDWYISIPVGLSMIGSFVADKLEDNGYNILFQMLARMLIPVIGGTTAFYIRDTQSCNNWQTAHPNVPVQQNSMIIKAFSNAIIAQGFAGLLNSIIYYIPIIGMVFTVLAYIPFMEYFILAVIYSIMYILINMFDNQDEVSYCADSGGGTMRTIFTGIGLVFIVLNELKTVIGGMFGMDL